MNTFSQKTLVLIGVVVMVLLSSCKEERMARRDARLIKEITVVSERAMADGELGPTEIDQMSHLMVLHERMLKRYATPTTEGEQFKRNHKEMINIDLEMRYAKVMFNFVCLPGGADLMRRIDKMKE